MTLPMELNRMPVLHFRTLRDGHTFGKGVFAFEGNYNAPIQITQSDLTQFDYQDPIVGQLSLKEVATFYFVIASTETNCVFNLNLASAEKAHALVAGVAQPHHLGAVSVPNTSLQLEWPTTEQGQAISPQALLPKAKILPALEVTPAPQTEPVIAAQPQPQTENEAVKTELAPLVPPVEVKPEPQAELPVIAPTKPVEPVVSKPAKGKKATPAAKATKKNSKTPAPAKTKPAPAVMPEITAKVIISNIHYKGEVKRTQADEYIEIKNVSTEIMNISGWRISAGSEGQDFTFPENTNLQVAQSVRVYTNEIHPETGGFSFGIGRAIWNDEGDIGSLYDQNGALIDKKSYGKFA